jgi:hypothetical protein
MEYLGEGRYLLDNVNEGHQLIQVGKDGIPYTELVKVLYHIFNLTYENFFKLKGEQNDARRND